MVRINRRFWWMAAVVTLAACGGDAPDAGGSMDEAPAEGGVPQSEADREMEQMMSHVERMGRMRGDSLQSMLPTHRQMMGNSLADMNADMRSMNMAADATWNALVDSLRADLVALPELSPAELEATMPDHLARFSRLLESHRAMMRAMGM